MACLLTTTWFDYLDIGTRIFQGLLAPIIGSAVAYIAYQQHKTNRDKIRLDLYDRRFKLYKEMTSFLGSIVTIRNISDNDLVNFLRNTRDAVFLFKDDIPNYISEIYTQAIELQLKDKEVGGKILGVDTKKAIEKQAEVFKWFEKQLEECTVRFKKYLSFENVD